MFTLPEKVFENLDMLAEGSGLFRVTATLRSQKEKALLATHPWKARLEALLKRAEVHHADWVYFRLQSDSGGPKPEIYIYDCTSSLQDTGSPFEIARLHLELWNYGKVPLAFVLRPTAVDIFNLLKAPEFGPSGLVPQGPLETLELSPAETLAVAGAVAKGIAAHDKDKKWQRFSGVRFDNGSFWEMPENRELGSSEKSSVAMMVAEMRDVRRKLEDHFAKNSQLPEDLVKYEKRFIHRLLILTLMVRFMEERRIIPPNYFKDKHHIEAGDFQTLLRHRTPLLRAFDCLANDFNGDIFKLAECPEEGEVPMHRILRELPDPEKALSLIADFANGRMEGGQLHFWERYSFRHLPVEAISYVYEDFLGNKSQSYFTPHHLVDLMLDEAMPPYKIVEALSNNDPRLEDSNPCFPVLDPSCGSGVFLVGAWHRLVEALHQLESEPSPELLKRLMQQNIHGVDVESDSVEITIFSLCVALCSVFPQKPDDPSFIFHKLRELKFPDLKSDNRQRRNIHARDFFTERQALINSSLRFQLIIGNPPFESKLERECEKAFDKSSPDEDGKDWKQVPDDNISYLFLRAVPPLLKKDGSAFLIQNASLLYNDKPKTFRKALFSNWHVTEVLDFASINGLFKKRVSGENGSADKQVASRVKVVAIMIEHREPDSSVPLLHVTFRRTAALDERGIFEIDPQDLHWVSRHVAANDPRLWTANLLGGGRLLNTYNSLTDGKTLKTHLAHLQKERQWHYTEGFIEGIGDKALDHRSEWRILPSESFIDDCIPEIETLPKSGITDYERPRHDNLFCPPHLLIKENEGFPMVLRLSGEKLLFRDKIIGMAAPDTQADKEELRRIHVYLLQNRRAAEFFTAFGPQYLIFRVGVPLKKSLDDLPYSRDSNVLFNGIQAYLRDDVIDSMIPLVKDTIYGQAKLAQEATPSEVEDYNRVFMEIMHSTFPDLQGSNKPYDLGRAWCVAFHRGDGQSEEFGSVEALKEHLDSLLIKDMGRALRCWRIVRHFHGKSLYIVKPKPRRYWLKSAAVRDADEMFACWSSQVAMRLKPQ